MIRVIFSKFWEIPPSATADIILLFVLTVKRQNTVHVALQIETFSNLTPLSAGQCFKSKTVLWHDNVEVVKGVSMLNQACMFTCEQYLHSSIILMCHSHLFISGIVWNTGGQVSAETSRLQILHPILKIDSASTGSMLIIEQREHILVHVLLCALGTTIALHILTRLIRRDGWTKEEHRLKLLHSLEFWIQTHFSHSTTQLTSQWLLTFGKSFSRRETMMHSPH